MKPLLFIPAFLLVCIACQGEGDVGGVIRDDRMGTQVHFMQGPGWSWRRWDLDKTMPLLAKSGLTWLRNGIYWGQVERVKGQYEIPKQSLLWIEKANAAGLKVSITFNGGNTLYADKYDPVAYAKAAAYVAKALEGKIGAIEILNEPYGKAYAGYYSPDWNAWNGLAKDKSVHPWVRKYVTLINTAAKAIRAANPDIKIIGLGSLPPVNFRQLAMGIAPEVDGITDHPYSGRLIPELMPWAAQKSILKRDGIATADEKGTFSSQIAMYRAQSKKYNGPKELWLTEWGWSTFQEAKSSGNYAGYTESAQAKYTLRRFVESIGLGVDESFQYDFKDDGDGTHPTDAEHNFGMIRADYTPKPAYYAVQRLAATLDNAAPKDTWGIRVTMAARRPAGPVINWDGSRLVASGLAKCYQFMGKNGEAKAFIWSEENADGDLQPALADIEITPALPAGARASFYDIYLDKTKTYDVETKGDRSVIHLVTIPDSPVCMTIKK